MQLFVGGPWPINLAVNVISKAPNSGHSICMAYGSLSNRKSRRAFCISKVVKMYNQQPFDFRSYIDEGSIHNIPLSHDVKCMQRTRDTKPRSHADPARLSITECFTRERAHTSCLEFHAYLCSRIYNNSLDFNQPMV